VATATMDAAARARRGKADRGLGKLLISCLIEADCGFMPASIPASGHGGIMRRR
jgi:hypothetical protein